MSNRRVGGFGRGWLAAALALLLALMAGTRASAQAEATLQAYRLDVPVETTDAKTQRLARLAARRAGPIIIAHRGATDFAPNDTLDSFAAAMDLGADGWEMDIRRTKDGVLVCFHDDFIEETTRGFGAVEEVTYAELVAHAMWRARNPSERGVAPETVRPPTLAAALTLARQRGALLDLDVKDYGITAQIAAILNEADAWDHVLAINEGTIPTLRTLGSITTRPYTNVAFYSRRDMDRTYMQTELAKPSPCIIVDDPRVAGYLLGRPAWAPVPMPPDLETAIPAPTVDSIMVATEDRPTSRAILLLSREAQQLGDGPRSPEAVARLRAIINERSFSSDWRWHSLEGSQAVRSLVRLDARDQAPLFAELLYRPEPRLQAIWNPSYGSYRWQWLDWRLKRNLIEGLGGLRHEVAVDALMTYVYLPAVEVEKLAPQLYAEATIALFRQRLTSAQVRALLTHPYPQVRNQAVVCVLDGDDAERTAILTELYPWTVNLMPLSAVDAPSEKMFVR